MDTAITTTPEAMHSRQQERIDPTEWARCVPYPSSRWPISRVNLQLSPPTLHSPALIEWTIVQVVHSRLMQAKVDTIAAII